MTLSKRLLFFLTLIPILLLVPLLAMQFTSEVNWSATDFLVMGLMLSAVASMIELVLQKIQEPKQRIILLLIILTLFFLIWAELAVGLFGTPFGGS